MEFDPKDANAHLIPSDTWLEALIVSAEEKTSRSGNQMIEASFKVYDSAGKQPTIKHYFVSHLPGMFKKICKVLELDFESGSIPAAELVNKTLFVKVKIQKDEEYGDKNVIAMFADKPPDGVSGNNTSHASRTPEDDGIPF